MRPQAPFETKRGGALSGLISERSRLFEGTLPGRFLLYLGKYLIQLREVKSQIFAKSALFQYRFQNLENYLIVTK